MFFSLRRAVLINYKEGKMNKVDFIKESNRIEGITRAPLSVEIERFDRFMSLDEVTIADLEAFVKDYQPDAVLRDKIGLNVRVGSHIPPMGGPDIKDKLSNLLNDIDRCYSSSFYTHLKFEHLHPFTDGNGRCGRMLWMWQMKEAPLGFLHHFYYQTLSFSRSYP
jgi:hypothetical protein